MNRRSLIITFAICLLAVAVAFVVKRCPRTVPFEQCSELYQRYADTEGIEASFIQGYRINDSIRVDVTLLQATDSAAWVLLMKDFKIPVIPPEYEELISKKAVSTRLFPKNHPELTKDTTLLENDILVYYRKMYCICICHIESENQVTALLKKEIHATKYNTNKLIYEKKDDHSSTLRSAGSPSYELPEGDINGVGACRRTG